MKLCNVYLLLSVFLFVATIATNNDSLKTTHNTMSLQIAEGGIGGSGVIPTDAVKQIHT